MELLKKNSTVIKKTKFSFSFIISKYKETALICLISFFIGRINLTPGISPFALPFLLASGKNPVVSLSALLGLWSMGSSNFTRYLLAVLFGLTLSTLIKWIFPKIDENKVNPSICLISYFIFGLCFTLFKDYFIYDILVVIFEAVSSFALYYVFKKGTDSIIKIFDKKYFTLDEIITFLFVIALFIAGMDEITLSEHIKLKNIAATYIVFLGAASGNLGLGAQISTFAGIGAGCGSDMAGIYIASYSINGLLSSMFYKYGKIITVMGFTLGNVILNLITVTENYMVISYLEIAIAALIYIIFPDILFKKLFMTDEKNTFENSSAMTIKNVATVKLDRLSIAFKKLADTITETLSKKEKVTVDYRNEICEELAERVCKNCALRFYCWQKDYNKTIDSLFVAIKKINTKGKIKKEDLPEAFKNKCVKLNDILLHTTSLYEIYRLNSVWQNKMNENTRIYKEQFTELSDIVSNLKKEIEKNPYFDKKLSLDISSALENDGINIKSINVLKDSNENTQIELTLFPCQKKDKCYKFIEKRLTEILEIPFIKVSGKCSFKECILRFKEGENFFLNSSVKQNTKTSSEKNGDNYSIKTLDNSTRYIILCDGSGSGKVASFYSKNTIKLMEEFLKTGFSKTTSVKLINSSLMCSGESDYFSTIDLSILDLKNGELEILKRGACPTYIKKADGEFIVIKNNSFPAGIVENKDDIINKIKLSKDDMIIMLSDGIYDSIDKEDWIVDALKAIKSDDPDIISDTLLKIARTTKNKDKDDMTVIVSKVSNL